MAISESDSSSDANIGTEAIKRERSTKVTNMELVLAELHDKIASGKQVELEVLSPEDRRAARILISTGDIRGLETASGLTALHSNVF